MEASFEISVHFYQTAWCHVPEGSYLNSL